MTGRRTAIVTFAITVIVIVIVMGSLPLGATVRSEDAPRARRVLIFSLPYVSWGDVDRASMPELDAFVRRASVAALSTRVDQRATPLADGYATIGAGTRTVGVPATDGDGRMVSEPFGVSTAGEAYTRRTGRVPRGRIVQPGIQMIVDANNRLHYDTQVGLLADTLARAGIVRAVIANADGLEAGTVRVTADGLRIPRAQRQAVLGLMDGTGQVAGGDVRASLLASDAGAPAGVMLDPERVEAAFTEAWHGRTAVLVEASDLVRARRAAPVTGPTEQRRQLDAAMRSSDALFGRLLGHVDLARDTVIVVGPAPAPNRITLTPLAIRGPGYEPGLLRSATTRRSGFVQINDVAPTVLRSLHVARPSDMEGTPAQVGSTGGTAASRLHDLRRADAAAQFRDDRIGEFYGVLVGAAVALVLVAALALWGRAPAWRPVARFVALWTLGLLVAAFLVRLFALDRAGVGAFYGVLFAIGLVVAVVCTAIGRRRPVDDLIAGALAVVAVLTLDALRGAPLVLNSVLGYSPTVAGRFAGFGNPAYAAYAACALVAAVLLAHRLPGRRGIVVAGAVLGVAVVVDVAPMLGSDVGGILSMVPAYAVTMAVLTGRRVRVRTVVAGLAAMVAVLVVATLVDLARPAPDRTHLGRLVTDVRDNGIGDFLAVIQRKLGANVSSLGSNILGLVLLVVAIGFVVVWWRDRDRLTAVLRAVPPWRAACLGFVVLAVLGFALNDSGVTVPGIMLLVFLAAWVHLLATVPEPEPPAVVSAAPDPRNEPALVSR